MYINMQLPSPLSKEEQAKFISMLPDEYAVSMLVEHNLRLVIYIANKFSNTGYETDELVSVGTIGLLKAVRTFKVDAGVKLATYAAKCISNEILMWMRRNKKFAKDISMEMSVAKDKDNNELKLEEVVEDKNNFIDQLVEVDNFDDTLLFLGIVLAKSSELYFSVVAYSMVNKTQHEVSEIVGVTQSYISRVVGRIFRSYKQARRLYEKVGLNVFPTELLQRARELSQKLREIAQSGSYDVHESPIKLVTIPQTTIKKEVAVAMEKENVPSWASDVEDNIESFVPTKPGRGSALEFVSLAKSRMTISSPLAKKMKVPFGSPVLVSVGKYNVIVIQFGHGNQTYRGMNKHGDTAVIGSSSLMKWLFEKGIEFKRYTEFYFDENHKVLYVKTK